MTNTVRQRSVATVVALASFLLLGAAPPAPGLKVTDLVGEFDQLYMANADKPAEEQAKAIRAHFASVLPGFYDGKRFKEDDAAYIARLAKQVSGYAPARTATLATQERFTTALGPAVDAFEKVFGPIKSERPVYLVVSFGEFDGGTRDLGSGSALLFGADTIAKYHGDHDTTPFFHHELFHLIHEPVLTECGEGLWCALWEEGLATYVAKSLNPAASDAELLLTLPRPIRPEVDANRTRAACAVLSRLDKGDEYGALFTRAGNLDPALPPRFGYYVGMLVAEDLGKGRSLPELAQLTGKPLRAEIEASLKRMGDGCA